MGLKKRKKVISIVDNERLYFVEVDQKGEKQVADSVKLADLLDEDSAGNLIPFSTISREISLLIVPDYWFGNFVAKFQSTNKSLADGFVERKLQAQFPQLLDVKLFYDSVFFQREHKEQWLYAYFLQDPQFFQLYKSFSKLTLTPRRITSPALIWGSKIRPKMSDFNDGGKCFIELLGSNYNLYFFFEGNFLFSRSIPLAGLETNSPDNLQAITYELNQSLYLFSQRTKAEVGKLYLISSDTTALGALSEALGREIKDLGFLFDDLDGSQASDASAVPIESIARLPSLLKNQFLFVSHKNLKKEWQWRPVQSAGIAIALFLCLLLGLESIFLQNWSRQHRLNGVNSQGTFHEQTKQKIRQYNQALDNLIENAERVSPRAVIANLARSLPREIRVQKIFLQTDTGPALDFEGIAEAMGSDRLKGSLAVLIVNLNQNLQPRRPLNVADIDIESDKNNQNYLIKFRMEL